MTLCDPTAEPSVPTSSTGSPGRAQQLPRAPTASCSKWRLLRQFYNWSPLSSWGDSAFLFNAAFIWLLFFFFFLFPFIFRVSLFGGFFFPRLFLCLQFFPVVREEVGSAEPGVPPLRCLPGCLFIALLSLICRDVESFATLCWGPNLAVFTARQNSSELVRFLPP